MVRYSSLAGVTKPKPAASIAGRVHPTSARRQKESAAAASTGDQNAVSTDRAPVIRSKIQPPPLRSSTLSRQRLIERLNDAVGSRLTLVVAEAGYGKTTLLADFSSRASVRCLWYKLDPTDADPVTWTNYVIAAAREVDPDFGQSTLAVLAQVAPGGPPKSAFVASLLGELPRLGEAPTVLVLDDFHAVDDSAEAREFLARLIKDAPPWLHFVISTRRRPVLELGRLAAMGEVAEITTDELRFTVDETERLFAQSYGLALDADVLRDVETRTQGWAASLQLFHGSVRGKSSSAVRALAKSLSGASKPIYDFLAQEVLNNLPDDLEDFLVRVALLDRIVAAHVVELFAERRGLAPSMDQAHRWIDECDRLGLLSRASQQSEARHLHPLLRDFLVRTLTQRHSVDSVRRMHRGLARAVADDEPLLASRHYLEAGDKVEAMQCLGRSVMLTMGSGQWGVASSLIDRLGGVPADPAVAAIRARRLIEEGDLSGAADLLANVDLTNSSADVRAVVRYSRLSLGWRTDDRDLMYATLHAVQSDNETPVIMREIFQIFVDASPMAARRASLPSLGQRLAIMAQTQAEAGHEFYAAISLHNAAVAYMNAGDFRSALRLGDMALEAFARLPFPAAERFSTHAIMVTSHLELGSQSLADDQLARATGSGEEFADVAAEQAFNSLVTGDVKAATLLLARADSLVREGRTDAIGTVVAETAWAFSFLPSDPVAAIDRLDDSHEDGLMDFGQPVSRRTVLALAYFLAGRDEDCLVLANSALTEARNRLARRSEARLGILVALSRGEPSQLSRALTAGAGVGHLALAELADALANRLDMLPSVPIEIEESIARWPARWVPALRRQLDKGDVPAGRVAARLLDRYGELQDVGRLRAYSRTYRKRGRLIPVGLELAQRVSPRLEIRDLGRVSISMGDRVIGLAGMRRKPASLLMYLLTRPALAANREQVFDALWPDADPNSASNSLNQSLYFLRRELDPWYEDDLSVDYVALQGELVWLDPALVKAQSVAFLAAAQSALKTSPSLDEVMEVLGSYRAPFAPEFEYEQWAISWRSRVHTTFLELASRTVDRAIREGDLHAARDTAVGSLDVDPENSDMERRLVWLYWKLGARAAAAAQYEHLSGRERKDGLRPTAMEEILAEPVPFTR